MAEIKPSMMKKARKDKKKKKKVVHVVQPIPEALILRCLKMPMFSSFDPRGKMMGIKKYYDEDLPPGPTWKARLSKLSTDDLANFHRERKAFVHYVFGTAEPMFPIYGTHTDYSTDGSGILSISGQNFGWGYVFDYNDWNDMFDEVQVIRGHVEWYNTYLAVTAVQNPLIVGAIDYGDSTAMTSYDAGSAYDTAQQFRTYLTPGHLSCKTKWKWHSQGQPDLAWIPTTDVSTYVSFFKVKQHTAGVVSQQVGVTISHYVVKFRQIKD